MIVGDCFFFLNKKVGDCTVIDGKFGCWRMSGWLVSMIVCDCLDSCMI